MFLTRERKATRLYYLSLAFWREGKLLRITANFIDHGCLRANDEQNIVVFQHLWGSVERLKQLIAKIEGDPQAEAERSSSLFAGPNHRI
jgi:hypothetical protein